MDSDDSDYESEDGDENSNGSVCCSSGYVSQLVFPYNVVFSYLLVHACLTGGNREKSRKYLLSARVTVTEHRSRPLCDPLHLFTPTLFKPL